MSYSFDFSSGLESQTQPESQEITPPFSNFTTPSSASPSPPPSTFQHPSPPAPADTRRAHQFCDALANKFALTVDQRRDLRTLASHGSTLDFNLLRINLFQQATIFRNGNIMEQNAVDYKRFEAVLQDCIQLLNQKYTMTPSQLDTMMTLAKDAMVNPTENSYMTIHADIELQLKERSHHYGLDSVFGNEAREKVLRQNCRVKASSARNQFRQWIGKTIDGPQQCTLTEAALLFSEKFKRGGAGRSVGILEQLRAAEFRRFHHDYYPEEDKDAADEDDEGVELNANGEIEFELYPRKLAGKNSRRNGGFWGSFDEYIATLEKAWGTDRKADKWKEYYNEIVLKDYKQWGKPRDLPNVEVVPMILNANTQMANATPAQSSNAASGSQGPLGGGMTDDYNNMWD